MSSSVAVDVVVVHYWGLSELRGCLAAIAGQEGVRLRTVVVDNAAMEPMRGEWRGVQAVVRTPGNLGFAAGANLGAARGRAPLILFLNPDVRLPREAISRLAAVVRAAPAVVAAAPLLRRPDGGLQVGAGGYLPGWTTLAAQHLPPMPGLSRLRRRAAFLPRRHPSTGDPNSPRVDAPWPVEWLSGACLLVRRRAFQDVGGFDEDFFLYGEDLDLGLRLGRRGGTMLLHPLVVVDHGVSAPDRQRSGDTWLDGLDRYYRKHRPASRRAFHAVGALGFAGRAALRFLSEPSGGASRRTEARRAAAWAWRCGRLAVSR